MFRARNVRRAALAILGLVLLLGAAGALPTRVAGAHDTFVDPAFQRVWNHCDKPVADQVCARSWIWGPDDFAVAYEPYADAPGGQRLVSYFDKSRMEINNPVGDRSSMWFVTNGLLVVEMATGQLQMGNHAFVPAVPAAIPVAGDRATSVHAPTYATLAGVMDRAPDRTGQWIQQTMNHAGQIGLIEGLGGYARYGVYEPTLGHNIADVFWRFMNQEGPVYHDGRYATGPVVNWVFAMGYPITEPYWIGIRVGGQDRWVLMQAFQRRILTYDPQNPAGWQVEMGNVGRAYYDWRYGPVVPAPTATPRPAPTPAVPAEININPDRGTTNTTITVTGQHFPAHAAVTIGVEQVAAGYARSLATVEAAADGAFRVSITLPPDAARFAEVAIVATVQQGAVHATQPYYLRYDPRLAVTPLEVLPHSAVQIHGADFPARSTIQIGFWVVGSAVDWQTRVGTTDAGTFDTTLNVGTTDAGTQFAVVATGDGGLKAVSDKVTVLAQPTLQVAPASGPVNVTVTVRGTNWPPQRTLRLGLHGANREVIGWLADPPTTDSAGAFTAAMWIGPQYGADAAVYVIAMEPRSGLRVESAYQITPPAGPVLVVIPNTLVVGQQATVQGSRWPAGAVVALGLGRGDVEEWVATATADGNGAFTSAFVLGGRWQNAGQILLRGVVSNGPSAAIPLWVVPAEGRVVPGGQPLDVWTYQWPGYPTFIKVTAAGWPPSQAVEVRVISGDATLNQFVTQATIKEQGHLEAGFNAAAPWWGRADLGVRVGTTDGQYSVRYLPVAQMGKSEGNRYEAYGVNWPAQTVVRVLLHAEGGEQVLGEATTDAWGAFHLSVVLPRLPESNKNDVEIWAVNTPYHAVFDF